MKMSKGKIVIVEGTSCVGKTTLCESLQKEGWIVIPEAIRYLEKETGKIGDEASPIPGSQAEEEYYQDQLFRVERQKIIEAIIARNITRNHVLEGIGVDEETIYSQREVLEKMTQQLIGNIGKRRIKKGIIDTSRLSKEEVRAQFKHFADDIEMEEFDIR